MSPGAVVVLFVLDIMAHLAVTVAVGVWLNRRAEDAVSKAAKSVLASLIQYLPFLNGTTTELKVGANRGD